MNWFTKRWMLLGIRLARPLHLVRKRPSFAGGALVIAKCQEPSAAVDLPRPNEESQNCPEP